MRLKGALAAALTPYRAGGVELDDAAFEPYAEYLLAGGVHGVLAGGTTGEGILQTPEERIRGITLFARSGLTTIAHCGAQTTADTVRLAAAAAEAGAAAVAVIAPPYFRLDDRALLAHFQAAAAACAPMPFYVYEFEAVSGYAASIEVVSRLRDHAPNYVGLKVSDAPWARFAPYLLNGLDVFVGPEALIAQGMASGAVGAVSGLAAAFPERVAAAVARPDGPDAAALGELRAFVEQFPRHAALKRIVQRRGVDMTGEVRRPLRQLTDDERDALDAWLDTLF